MSNIDSKYSKLCHRPDSGICLILTNVSHFFPTQNIINEKHMFFIRNLKFLWVLSWKRVVIWFITQSFVQTCRLLYIFAPGQRFFWYWSSHWRWTQQTVENNSKWRQNKKSWGSHSHTIHSCTAYEHAIRYSTPRVVIFYCISSPLHLPSLSWRRRGGACHIVRPS